MAVAKARRRRRNDILVELRALAKRLGHTPRSTDVSREALGVYRDLFHHFHTMSAAVEAAGLAPVTYPRTWSRERVVKELRRLDRLGYAISRRKLVDRGRYDLVNAIATYWGGMVAARRAAGLPPPSPGRRGKTKWSEDEVITQIKERRRHGRTLASSKVPRKLHDAANYYLGSWRDAVEAAGIDYDEVRLTRGAYQRREIIATLRGLSKAHPDMTLTELRRHRIRNGVDTSFDSLESALRAAGLHTWPRRDRRRSMPTARETLALVRARNVRGRSMLRTAVLRDDPRLERAATRNFGGWLHAVRAAGLNAVGAPRGRHADRQSRLERNRS